MSKGKVNYIGDIIINWNLGKATVDWGEFFLSHGNAFHRYGLIDIAVTSNDKTLNSFFAENPSLKKEDSVNSQIKFIDTTKL